MAKLTAAERKALELQEELALEKELEDAYPEKFLTTVQNALVEGFQLQRVVADTGYFVFQDPDDDCELYTFSAYFDPTKTWELDNFQDTVAVKTAERVEAQRLSMVRQAALAKLSREEKEVLGLRY